MRDKAQQRLSKTLQKLSEEDILRILQELGDADLTQVLIDHLLDNYDNDDIRRAMKEI